MVQDGSTAQPAAGQLGWSAVVWLGTIPRRYPDAPRTEVTEGLNARQDPARKTSPCSLLKIDL